MRNIWILYRKELKSYFSSWIAYLLMACFAVIFGWFFYNLTGYFTALGLRSQMMGQPIPMDLNERIVGPLLANMGVIGLFIIPLVTMRLFAEEKRSGTIELLMTSPVHDYQMVVAKWFSALTLYASVLALPSLNLVFLFVYGKPDWRPILVGYLGLLLQAGALLAIGTFISTMTKNQIIAAGATFVVCLMLWVLEWVAGFETATWAKVLAYLAVATHSESFFKGVVDSKDVAYYLSLTFFGLFMTTRSMESLRWRA